MPGLNPPPPDGRIQGDTTLRLGGMPTPETSVDVLLSTSVTEPPSRIQHALSVLQWFVGKCASCHPRCRSSLSVDNTEKRFTDSSSISGCLRLIKYLPEVHNALLLQFPKENGSCLPLYYTTEVVPKPVAANKLWTIIPNHSSSHVSASLGNFQSPPVKMHLPRLRRPMSSIQSYHHPLMHDAHYPTKP